MMNDLQRRELHREAHRSLVPLRRSAVVRRLQRGQAMVEYTIVAHFLLLGGGLVLLPLIVRLFDALNTFYKAIYLVLETGAV